jgi:tRNA modification GTPase
MKKNSDDDTIVAVSTPVGGGGIGIVRLSGRDSIRIADSIFISSDKRKASEFKTHSIHYGHIVEKSQGHKVTRSQVTGYRKPITENRKPNIGQEVIDEVLLTVMKAPRTYTREDVVEINCHGGMTALRRTLELIVEKGARVAEPGEFTKRAFLNGRLDLTQAEAVLDIIRAKTDTALRASINQLEGELSREVNSVRNSIIDVCADVEAMIDFPEEDIEVDITRSWLKKIKIARKKLESLRDTYHNGAILKNGITAVICGRANVGKSSLMNLLLRRDRVIVTHIPGTTRDAVEDEVNIKGIPIRLVDTAGFGRRGGIVEKKGVEKSRFYLSNADLILCVLDGSEKLKKDDMTLLGSINERCAIILINKCDLKVVLNTKEIKRIATNGDIIRISCLRKEGIDRLEDEVYNKIWSGKVHSSHQLMLSSARHKSAIDKAINSLCKTEEGIHKRFSQELLAIDIRESINVLGEIVGEIYTDDILDVIFSKFCIGK